jgi:hypothetical protein
MPISSEDPPREPSSETAPLTNLNDSGKTDWLNDLILPTLLFVALGGMTWAVRGSSGFGAWKGCVFAGVTWGAAWWYLAHDPRKEQSRRYASAWIVVALTFGIGIAGIQGWMQWPSLFDGKLMLNATPGSETFVEISPAYGFLWLFVAGAKWAGIGACFLAWCGSLRETRIWHWVLRIACGLIGAYLARFLIVHYPQYFLPIYDLIPDKYQHLDLHPNLARMVGDCTTAVYHLGLIVGFAAFEVFRRDWKNVGLILAVGSVNGIGWALFQNWKWAPHVFPGVQFNFWRCWESSGGLSMGLAFGLAYFVVNRPMADKERAVVASRRATAGPNFEWLMIFLGLTWLLSTVFRLEVPWQLPLPGWLAVWIRPQVEWSAIFFAIVCAWGAAYYIVYRQRVTDEPMQSSRSSLAWDSNDLVALFLTSALIVGLFLSFKQYHSIGQLALVDAGVTQLRKGMLFLTSFLGQDHAPARGVSADLGVVVMRLYVAGAMILGLAWYLMNDRKIEEEKRAVTPVDGDPNLERLGLSLGLLGGLGLSLQYGLKGWFNTYKFDERIWDVRLQHALAPVYLVILLAVTLWILVRPLPRSFRGNIFPHAAAAMWLVLLMQNAIAQAITGPLSDWQELAFNIYYAVLFAITALIVAHFQWVKKQDSLGLQL